MHSYILDLNLEYNWMYQAIVWPMNELEKYRNIKLIGRFWGLYEYTVRIIQKFTSGDAEISHQPMLIKMTVHHILSMHEIFHAHLSS